MRRRSYLIAPLLVLVGLFACNTPSELGLDFITQLNLIALDDFEVEINTVFETSYRTDAFSGQSASGADIPIAFSPAGRSIDPFLGRRETDWFATFIPRLLIEDTTWGESVIIDSFVLRVSFIGVDALSDSVVNFRLAVNFLNEVVEQGTEYFDSDSLAYDTTLAGPVQEFEVSAERFITDPVTGVTGFTVSVPLDTNVARAILNEDPQRLFDPDSLNNFLNIFKGVHVSVVPVDDDSSGFLHVTSSLFQSSSVSNILLQFREVAAGDTLPPTSLSFLPVPTTEYSDYGNNFYRIKRDFSTTSPLADGISYESYFTGGAPSPARNIFLQGLDPAYLSFTLEDIGPIVDSIGVFGNGGLNSATLEIFLDTTLVDSISYLDSTVLSNSPKAVYLAKGISIEPDFGNQLFTTPVVYFPSSQSIVVDLSQHMQDINRGDQLSVNFTLVSDQTRLRPTTGIYCGPGHPDTSRRPRLRIFLTPSP